ncbi:MAG: tetratricopeptide repeat protein [Burkholderiales bacterium]
MIFSLTRLHRHLIAIALSAALMPAFANMGAEESASSTEPNLVQGKQAIENKEYAMAVEALKKALHIDKNNPDIHNYLGYAYRNSGDFNSAFKHYEQALILSPGHKAAHEYIGEAYLITNDLAKAEEHLNKLRGICVTGCTEMSLLKEKIDAYKKKKG